MRLRKPSPTGIVAIAALVLALGGTAIAASRYVITSTSQIKPTVLAKLKGTTGPRGAQGRDGLPGRDGLAGREGAPGREGPPGTVQGPRGETGAEGKQGAEGKAGPKGETGLEGKQGPKGETGSSGGVVVARLRATEQVTTKSTDPQNSPTFVAVPSTGGTWTQGATEFDQLVGEVTGTTPSRATCSTTAKSWPAEGAVYVLLNGSIIGFALLQSTSSAGETQSFAIEWGHAFSTYPPEALDDAFFLATRTVNAIFEPGVATPRTLSLETADNCGVKEGNTGGHFKITSVSIDVIASK